MRWLRTAGILAVVFLTGAAQAEVPLSWDSTGHVVVPAMVNGKGPFERRHVVARVVDLPSLEGDGLAGGPAMILGLDLLRGTRLTVDLHRGGFGSRSHPAHHGTQIGVVHGRGKVRP